MKIVPLFGTGVRSYSDIATRQRRLNVLYDVRKDQDSSGIVAVGTPGSYIFVTLPTFPIYGWRVVGSLAYIVAGKTLYTVSTGGTIVARASLPTVAQNVTITDNSAQVVIVDGVAGYVYNIAGASVSTIVDANFPNGATSVAFLDGKFLVNVPNSREYRVSQTLDGTTWTPLINGFKENSSDFLQEVEVLNGTLILWGQRSIEFWQDVGSAPNPFQRINGASQSWGLVATSSHVKIMNTEIFLGLNPDGGIKVMMLEGYTPKPISDSDIDYKISRLVTTADAVGLAYTAYGHAIYQLTFPAANVTFAYDTKSGVWHEAQTGTQPSGRHYGTLGIAFGGKNYISDATTGGVYAMDETTYTDNGQAIQREVCTRHIRESGNWITLNRVFFDMEVGVGLQGAADPLLMLRVSRDGGRTFGPEKTKSIGAIGKYLNRIMFNRLGSGKNIILQIRMTDAVKFCIASGSAELESAGA